MAGVAWDDDETVAAWQRLRVRPRDWLAELGVVLAVGVMGAALAAATGFEGVGTLLPAAWLGLRLEQCSVIVRWGTARRTRRALTSHAWAMVPLQVRVLRPAGGLFRKRVLYLGDPARPFVPHRAAAFGRLPVPAHVRFVGDMERGGVVSPCAGELLLVYRLRRAPRLMAEAERSSPTAPPEVRAGAAEERRRERAALALGLAAGLVATTVALHPWTTLRGNPSLEGVATRSAFARVVGGCSPDDPHDHGVCVQRLDIDAGAVRVHGAPLLVTDDVRLGDAEADGSVLVVYDVARPSRLRLATGNPTLWERLQSGGLRAAAALLVAMVVGQLLAGRVAAWNRRRFSRLR